jgi:hypothetical protein
MAIPPLDERGLLPPGQHRCRLEDIPPRFCDTSHRKTLWTGFHSDFLPELHEVTRGKADTTEMVLGGSFFSDKPDPGDIEVTLVFPDDTPGEQCWHQLRAWKQHHTAWKKNYRIDYYPTLPGNNDFVRFLSYVGPKTAEAKGLREKDVRGILVLETW